MDQYDRLAYERESRQLIASLREAGVILSDDDSESEAKRAKKAKLARLRSRLSFLRDEQAKVAKALKSLDDDDDALDDDEDMDDDDAQAKRGDDSDDDSMDDSDDVQSSRASDGIDDDDLYKVLPNFEDGSRQKTQPHLRPGRALPSSGHLATEPEPRLITGTGIVRRARRLAEARGLNWHNPNDRLRAMTLAAGDDYRAS